MGVLKALAIVVLALILVGAAVFYEVSSIEFRVSAFNFRQGPRGEQLMDLEVLITNGGFMGGEMNITGSNLYIDGKLAAVLYRPSSFRLDSGSTANVTLTYRVVDAEPIRAMLARRTALLNVTLDSELSMYGVVLSLPTQTRAGRVTLNG